jgi:hypothetical protein
MASVVTVIEPGGAVADWPAGTRSEGPADADAEKTSTAAKRRWTRLFIVATLSPNIAVRKCYAHIAGYAMGATGKQRQALNPFILKQITGKRL